MAFLFVLFSFRIINYDNALYDSLLQEFNSLKPKLQLGINECSEDVKIKLEKYFNQFDKLHFYWLSYIKNHPDPGFRLSIDEILEIKNYREVFFEWELNPLLEKYITHNINKDLFNCSQKGSKKCVCFNCGYIFNGQPGVPCRQMVCPNPMPMYCLSRYSAC